MTTAPVPSITEELLAELEEKAKAATPGPWEFEVVKEECRAFADENIRSAHSGDVVFGGQFCEATLPSDEDFSHIAAANPATLLALIAHIRSLEARLEKTEKDAQRYQWLRNESKIIAGICFSTIGIPSYKTDENERKKLDTHIDASIAQEGQSHE